MAKTKFFNLDTDNTLGGANTSHYVVASQRAVKEYIDNNERDNKVDVTLGTTTKAYILGTSTTPTSTATAVSSIADTGVYLDTTAGQLTVGSLKATGLTASKWVKTDANKVLVTADLPVASTTQAGIVQLGTEATNAAAGNHNHDGRYFPYGGVVQNTNPFGGKKLYINSLDNALYAAGKRFWVRITTHNKVVDGVTYPYADTTKTIADADYWVDSPALTTTTTDNSAFNGNYEDGPAVGLDKYMKIHIQFAPFTDTWTPGTGTAFTGYPYGNYYVSYYFNNTPGQLSQLRVYNKYASHTVGWHLYNATVYAGSLANSYIEKFADSSDYQRSCIEFIIYGKDTGSTVTTTKVTEIEWQLDRPNLSRDGATVTKYGDQSLYFNFSWYKHTNAAANEATVTINADSGKITSNSIDTKSALTAVAIANNDAILIADSSNGDKITPSTTKFDGSTTTQYLSKKGTWENVPTFTDHYQSPDFSTGIKISTATGSGLNALYVPTGTTSSTVAAGNHTHPEYAGAMVFKGTLGTGGTYDSSTLPAAASTNTGWTLKVITDGIYRGVVAKEGDTLISDGTTWVKIPSGDEPTGTVTNISTGTGLTGGPITTTGTISHSDIETTTAVSTASLVKITTDGIGHIKTTGAVQASDIPALPYAADNHTHTVTPTAATTTKLSAALGSNVVTGSSGTASNMITSSVAPTATQFVTGQSTNVVTSTTSVNVHAAAGTPSTTLSTGSTGDVTVATGSSGTADAAAQSHTHSASATSTTAVSAYTSNTPTYKKLTTTTQTAGTAASFETSQTLITGTKYSDDYCMEFVFTANTPSTVATTVATGALETGTSSNGVLGSISFSGTNVAAQGHTHSVPATGTTKVTAVTGVSTTKLSATTTAPTITLSNPTGTTASGDVSVVGSSTSGKPTFNKTYGVGFASQPTLSRASAVSGLSSGTVGVTLSTGTTGDVDIPTNAISNVTVNAANA